MPLQNNTTKNSQNLPIHNRMAKLYLLVLFRKNNYLFTIPYVSTFYNNKPVYNRLKFKPKFKQKRESIAKLRKI